MIHILADVATNVAAQAPQAAEAAATAVSISGSIQGGLGCLGAAIGVGLVGARAVEAVGRNPGASGKILVQGILGMALAEAVAFYAIFL
jgi:F-type H+-transporting ATPase subunit c